MNVHNRLRATGITGSNWTIAALLCLRAATTPLLAGDFSVSPLRVELKGSHRLEVLTINNADDAPLAIQIELKQWSQANGEDQYLDTHDLLATPPLFKMAPHGQQVVRIALRGTADPARELDYRVFLTEIPQPPSKDFSGMQVALRLSLPVFIAPLAGAAQADLSWHAQRDADGSVRVTATNSGNAHIRVGEFDLQFTGQEETVHVPVSRYVLPQSAVSWTVNPPAAAQLHAGLQVHGQSDRGDFTAPVLEDGG